MEILNKSYPYRCHRLLQMQRHVLFRLCDELKAKVVWKIHDISAYMKVTMFSLTMGLLNFFIQDIFQHSGETVSRRFYVVPHTLATFAKVMVKPMSFDETSHKH